MQLREQVTGAQPRDMRSPSSRRPKMGYTIATSMIGSDNEWTLNESGPVTSVDEVSGTKTPQGLSPTSLVGQQVQNQSVPLISDPTPRAMPAPPRPRVQIHGFTPARSSHGVAPAAWISPPPEPSQYPQQQREFCCQQPQEPCQQATDSVQDVQHQSHPLLFRQPPTPPHIPDQIFLPKLSPRTPDAVPVVSGTLTASPTPTSTRSEQYPTNRSRPSSTRSCIAGNTLRPHPLIRRRSFGHGDLAPLKVSSDVAQVQLSSSLPVGNAASASLTSIRAIHNPSSDKRFSSTTAGQPSTSPTHSLSTPPMQSHMPIERGRTMSMLSTAPSSFPTHGSESVATPQNAPLMVHFPAHQKPHSHLETIHALLPSLYVTSHLAILQWYSPICESRDRVTRARFAASRHGCQ
jgi:hypothetical protein